MVHVANQAADRLAKEGIDCTVIDPRTTSPFDTGTIVDSATDTRRIVIVDEPSPRCNIATDISAMIAQEAFDALRAPIRMVCPPHVPVPFAPNLENLYVPNADCIEAAVRIVMRHERQARG